MNDACCRNLSRFNACCQVLPLDERMAHSILYLNATKKILRPVVSPLPSLPDGATGGRTELSPWEAVSKWHHQ
jgi:hypothetical protein